MTVVVATSATVRPTKLPMFVATSAAIVDRMSTDPGNLGVRVTSVGLVWYTLTAWVGHEALHEFVHSELHVDAMRQVDELTTRTRFAHIATTGPFDAITWRQARRHLAAAA